MPRPIRTLLALLLAGLPAAALAQDAQPQPPPGPPPPPPPAESAPPPAAAQFAPAALDQMLAPIALYPDPLLAQVLMAATYPLEVVAADRWLAEPGHAQLAGDALAAALAQQGWDPSVQSLVPFPRILQMMDSRLDWMQALGGAFLTQQSDVMASVQRLRLAAAAAGTLISNQYETVSQSAATIAIAPAEAGFVYVPFYDPNAVYGAWPDAAYPPVAFALPPDYEAVAGGIAFGVPIAIVAPLWGWNRWDWQRHALEIDRGRFGRSAAGSGPPTATAAETWRHDPARAPPRPASLGAPFRPAIAAPPEAGLPVRRLPFGAREAVPPPERAPPRFDEPAGRGQRPPAVERPPAPPAPAPEFQNGTGERGR